MHKQGPEDNKKSKTQVSSVKPAKTSEDVKKVSVFRLYRFTNTTERLLLILGTVVSVGCGACTPLLSLAFGDSTQSFGEKPVEALELVKKQCLLMLYVCIAIFVSAALMEAVWSNIGDRLGIKVRKMYLEAVLKKNVSWFDLNRPQELPTKIVALITKYQEGIGDKVGKVMMSLAMTVSGLILSFVYGWQLAFVFIAISPLTIASGYFIGVANTFGILSTKAGYAKCGGYAEEALSAIRTVYAFGAETIEKNKYLKELARAQSHAVKNALFLGLAVGLVNFTSSLAHGLGFLVGSFFIQYKVRNHSMDRDYDCSAAMIVFFSAFYATFSLGMIAPAMKDMGKAQISAYDIYELIDSVKNVNKNAPTGRIALNEFKGRIVFHNVTFYYPTRPDVKILDNFNMVFESGKMVGICGETGSGKSTIIQLLERFYTPTSGKITIDGVDINTLDLKWWREMIGYVGQEPVLFNATIRSNIEYGRPGASQEEIEAAARMANAEEFIKRLESKYDTITGAEGNKMSGGQKQRLAIARCLIKKPKILLLDEATSALDNTSEKKVQDAFYKLQKEEGMTVLVIAHRLSTIKKADKIIVLHDGVLKEEGNDQQLRVKNSIYANLCRLQEGVAEEVQEEGEQLGEKFSTRKESAAHKSLTAKIEDKVEEDPEVAKKKKEEEEKEKASRAKQYRSALWSENMKYKLPFFCAVFSGVIWGFYIPTTGVLFGMGSIDLLKKGSELRRLINLNLVGFLVAGFVSFILTLVAFWLFGYVGAKITYKLRDQLYTHVLKMDVGWFDLPANLPSNLNTVLAEGTEKINDVVGMIAGMLIQSSSSLAVAIIISLVLAWKISLIVLVCVPLCVFCAYIEAKVHFGFAQERENLYKKSMQILTEAVKNFRTVASFSSEERILQMYSEALEKPLAQSKKTSSVTGILFGISQALVYCIYAAVFYFAALFLREYNDDPRKMLMASYALLFAASSAGQAHQYAPDMGKAYAALFAVYGTLSQKPRIESPASPTKNEVKGKIEFKNVYFKYPTRKDYVLQDFSATIKAGEKVAIVGTSGSGKSTIIQLLERFYDIESGQILLDGVDIKEYSLADLRQSIGYVPQEPVLFDTTIEENVKYGNESKTKEEVKEACEVADATDFIMKDADKNEIRIEMEEQSDNMKTDERLNIDIGKGFDRKVGAKGSLLSGGQKQRLAIARAVLRKPKIMLFDEATSALDSETEKIVQKALNKVSQGRTSVVVAHRLGTIEDDDTIFVLENGKLVESGHKQELDNKKGSFHKLYGSVMAAARIKANHN